MNVHYTPLIARWLNGSYSIHFGTGEDEDIFTILDELGDPSGVEVRAIPRKFAGFISMSQVKTSGDFRVNPCEYFFNVEQLWMACTNVVWPQSDEEDQGWSNEEV